VIPIFQDVAVIDKDGNRIGKYYRFNRSVYREYEGVLREIVKIARSGEEIKWK
jgi:hypothetical protein